MSSYKEDEPLMYDRVKKLRALRPKEKAPSKVLLNIGTLNLARRSKVSLVKVARSLNSYKIQVRLQGDALGRRLPSQRIKIQSPRMAKGNKRAEKNEDIGLRLKHTKVSFVPKKVDLKLYERAKPPADFDYKKDDEILDKPVNVFLPDGRYIYQDTDFPWRTVGRVDTPLGYGTGCTIGSRLLLTASHNIQWNADNTAGWVRFRPSYYNGDSPFGEAWATTVIYWTKVIGGDGLTDQETAFDYVVCVLDSRVGDLIGFSGYRTYNTDWNNGSYWESMGYPSDLTGGERPAYQGGCVISTVGNESTAGQNGFVLGHFNDMVPGHSGGPIWGWWGNEDYPRVVGVTSAEASSPAMDTSGDNEYGGGEALSSLISWARDNYP